MFAALYSADGTRLPALLACAQEFSPRVEAQLGGRLVLIDIAGLGRIVGDAHAIASELRESLSRHVSEHVALARRTSHVTIVVAPSRIAALLVAVAGRDVVVLPGQTAAAVGALSLSVFDTLSNPRNQTDRPCALCSLAGAQRLCGAPGGACTELATLRRWGLSTLGDVAALPAADLSARLGRMGIVLQRLARGLDTQPLVPIVEEARFEASLDLEWPIEDLQPLSFVLARLLEPLGASLERADRAAAAIVTELTLVRLPASFLRGDASARCEGQTHVRKAETTRSHVRRLELPAPMRDPRVLRTLILLDLESHPPAAGIDRVAIRIEPTPGRVVQFSLLERAGPQPETIATLVSRLTALMSEGRVGSPVLLDSHAPDAFAVESFGDLAIWQSGNRSNSPPAEYEVAKSRNCQIAKLPNHQIVLSPVLRRFRLPVAARVVMDGDRLVRVTTDRIGIKGGDVRQCAGPWRSSGHWWASAWDRDEYDVALGDGAAYRIYRDRHQGRWFIEGILD